MTDEGFDCKRVGPPRHLVRLSRLPLTFSRQTRLRPGRRHLSMYSGRKSDYPSQNASCKSFLAEVS